MSVNVLAAAARQSVWMLAWQATWIVVLAGLVGLGFGARAGWSALTGGAIGLVWTVYMALSLVRHSVTHGAGLSAMSFFVGWAIKVVLTVSLLIIAFRSRVFTPVALLGGLFGAMVAYWAWLAFRVRFSR